MTKEYSKKIAVVVDSIADIPENLLETYGIYMIPIHIRFGDREFLDKVELDNRRFYRMLSEETDFPRTSQPSPAEFKALYSELLKDHEQILSIHISSKLSGTFQSAKNAAADFEPGKIRVMDSLSGGMAQGLIAVRAAEAIGEGASLDEAADLVTALSRNRKIYLLFESLDYIVKGGRLNRRVGSLLTKLKLMPLVTYTDEGALGRAGIIRTGGRAFGTLIKRIAGDLNGKQIRDIAIIHADAAEKAVEFKILVEETFHPGRIFISEIGPGLGAYAGPGTIAFAFFTI